MAITVGDIYTAFPTFKPLDMIDLMGTDNFNGRSEVSLSKIAHYKGGMAQELSLFTAKKEGKNFTNLLSKSDREKVSEHGNIGVDKNSEPNPSGAHIPMDISIFNVSRQQV